MNFGISLGLSNAKIEYIAINSYFPPKIIILGCLNQQFQIDPAPHSDNMLSTFSQFCILKKEPVTSFV